MMLKKTTAPATQRLRFLQTVADTGWSYSRGQVADVPAPLAAQLLKDRQAIEVADAIRFPVWAVCPRCSSTRQAIRFVDGRLTLRWSDEQDTSPSWQQCGCGAGWLR